MPKLPDDCTTMVEVREGVDATEPGETRLDRRGDRLRVLHVEARDEHAVESGEFGLRIRIAHRRDDVPSLVSEQLRRRSPESARRAGDENRLCHDVHARNRADRRQ